jgi:serine/threonine-protein kinase
MTDGTGYRPQAGDGGQLPGGVPRLLGGRYELAAQIGRGGMAEVFSGRDARLGRTVAVKVLKSDLARDPAFQSRFKREAQSAASLNHPASVAGYDTGDEQIPSVGGGTTHLPYIVMEYLQGRTLKEVLTEHGRLSVDDSLRVTAGVLDALQYSHRNGIVHRDIKPANVMVTDAGEIKVMDFGIARAITDTGATMTGTNAVLGTAQYLSPEQAKGETVDNRSDLYSTACLLYELLTGRPPFVGDSPVSLAYQHVGEQPQPPGTLVPGLPPDLDRVVMRGLAKDRTTRYQSAEDFISDLDRVATGVPVAAAAADSTRVAPPMAAGAAGVAGAAVGGAAAAAATSRMAPTEAPNAWPVTSAPAQPAQPGYGAYQQGYGQGGGYDSAYQQGYPSRGGYDDVDDEPRRNLLWLWILLAVLALAAVGVLAAVFLRDGGDPSVTPTSDPTESAASATPIVLQDVTNQNITDAIKVLTDLGFTDVAVADTPPVEDLTKPAGTVLSMTPTPGQPIDPKTPIRLTISSLPGNVSVPDVGGKSQQEAQTLIEGQGLVWGDVSTIDDPDNAQGLVVRTEPATGIGVPPGTRINIFIASGQVQVPDLFGKTVDEAKQILGDLGLTFNQVTVNSPEPAGTVIEQSDTGGVPIGSRIDISVSSGTPTTTTTTTTTTSSSTTTTSTSGTTTTTTAPAG